MAPWLNLIEGFFSKLARSVFAPHPRKLKHELQKPLIGFIDDINPSIANRVVHTVNRAQNDPRIGTQKGSFSVGGKGAGSEQEGPARREVASRATERRAWEVPVCPPGSTLWMGLRGQELIRGRSLWAVRSPGVRRDRVRRWPARLERWRLSGRLSGQSLEPDAIFGLEGDEDSNGIAPALSVAAMVSRSPVATGQVKR
jgi:hypothetical protein